jgi:ADP-dependent NAD(P)H-hydrate dehydratase / NAD(P)H-hydrate epimerase
MRLVTTAEMRALERGAFAAGVSEDELMATAGTGAGRALAAWLGWTARGDGRRVLVLAGRGNNGGDAIIAARALAEHFGAPVCVYLVSARERDPLLAWTGEAGVPVATHGADGAKASLRRWLSEAAVVLDGILGIGGRLPLRGPIAETLAVCREVRPAGQRRVAVDVPTGVQADTGQVDALAFRADLTLSTGPAKVGLFIHPGAEHAGRVQTVDLGIVPADAPLTLWRQEAPEVAQTLPPRPDDSNKGTYGKVLVVAGCERYVGAAGLAARAAVRAGAGLVTLAVPEAVRRAIAGSSLETTYLTLPPDPEAPGALGAEHAGAILDAAAGYDALAIGPGIGDHPATRRLVLDLAAGLARNEHAPPAVLDADALNALSAVEAWPHPGGLRWVLTPHPGEMGRLLDKRVPEVQADRLATARGAAARWGQAVVLKGAPSIVAGPDGRACLTVFANAALASAGSGDVLTGTVAALLAQGLDPFAAAAGGSYLHGLAGERWRAHNGDAGLGASRLAECLPGAARALRSLA